MPSFRQNNLLAWTIFACLVVVPLSHIKTELLVDNLQRQGGALGKDFSVSDGAACNRPWVESNPFPLPTAYGGTAASDGTYVYVAGGYSIDRNMTLDAFRRFDPVTNIWTLLAPLPDAVFVASAVFSPINNKIYVFGGEFYTPGGGGTIKNTTRIYDIATNTWTLGPPMPGTRVLMASGYYNGKIYLVGGYDDPIGTPRTQVWEYDPVTNIFVTTRSPIPHARGGAGFGIINGHFYVAGGFSSENVLDDYDIAANTWTPRANLPTSINDPGSGVVNGQLWLFGGQTKSGAVGTSMFYDPPSDTWSTGPEMNIARSFCAGTGIGNALICIGGANGPNQNTSIASTEVSTCAPTVQNAFSRKVHGGAGSFDIPLPLSVGNVGIECRSGGATNDYQMIINFAASVTASGAAVTSGSGNVSSFTISGSQITVNLTRVANDQTIRVTLSNVNDGDYTANVAVSMGVVVGDANGDRQVNASDTSLTKAQTGQVVSASNFREDINADGAITSSDVALVKANAGSALP